MFIAISRTFKEALSNFYRNGLLSIAAISILVFSLYIIGLSYVIAMTGDGLIKTMQEKINISVYFNSSVSEGEIQDIKIGLGKFKEIKSVEYVSKTQALEAFKKENANVPTVIKALDEIGSNPLLSSLVIQANDPSQYDALAQVIAESDFRDKISRINYDKNKTIIDRLNNFIAQVKKVGMILGGIFVAIAILITFNTIRITIYVHKQEIEVKRLVGASNTFIKLPFIFEGMIYGIVASLFSMALIFATAKFAGAYVAGQGFSDQLVGFYMKDFWLMLGLQAALGALLGVISSFIAIRKYLKV